MDAKRPTSSSPASAPPAAARPSATPGGVELAPRVHVPANALEFSFSRSGGPGGQNVNKLATRVQMRVPMEVLRQRIGVIAADRLALLLGPSRLTASGDVLIASDESRSQHANRATCMERLREMLVEATRPRRVRKKTRPTAGSKRRRLESKKQRGATKRQRSAPRDE